MVSCRQDATKLEYSHYVKYIEERFPPEVPQMFGLPPVRWELETAETSRLCLGEDGPMKWVRLG